MKPLVVQHAEIGPKRLQPGWESVNTLGRMRTFTPDDFSGDDTKKVQNTIDAAREHYGRAYFPWTGRPYELEDTILIEPNQHEDQVFLTLEGDPVWKLFEYHGPPNKSVFRTLGLKGSTLRNIGLRCFASNCYGFDVGGDADTQSSSMNLYENLRFQSEPRTHGNTGFSIGRGGNDHSCSVLWRCTAIAVLEGRPQDPGIMDAANEAGHTGYSCVGGNNLAQAFRDCTGSGQRVLFKLAEHNGHKAGGARSVYDNCAGTGCCLGYLVDGGFGVQIRGGRWEHCGSLLVHGASKKPGRGRGTVLLSSVTADYFYPVSGAVCGLFEPGEFIGIRSDAEFVIQACEYQQYGSPEPLDERAVRIASTSNFEATLIWQANLGIPLPEGTQEGRRTIVQDGKPKPLKVKPG